MKKPKLIKDWKRQLHSYSFLSFVAILFSTLSWGGLAVLGVMSSWMTMWGLLSTALFFALMGMVGRLLQQFEEDAEEKEATD